MDVQRRSIPLSGMMGCHYEGDPGCPCAHLVRPGRRRPPSRVGGTASINPKNTGENTLGCNLSEPFLLKAPIFRRPIPLWRLQQISGGPWRYPLARHRAEKGVVLFRSQARTREMATHQPVPLSHVLASVAFLRAHSVLRRLCFLAYTTPGLAILTVRAHSRPLRDRRWFRNQDHRGRRPLCRG